MRISLAIEYNKLKEFVQICWDAGYSHCGVDSIHYYMGHANMFGLNTNNPNDQTASFPMKNPLTEEDKRSDRIIPLSEDYDRVSGGHMYYPFRNATSTLNPIIMNCCNGSSRQYCGNYNWIRWDLNTGWMETDHPKEYTKKRDTHRPKLGGLFRELMIQTHLPKCFKCEGSGRGILQFEGFRTEFLCDLCFGMKHFDWVDHARGRVK